MRGLASHPGNVERGLGGPAYAACGLAPPGPVPARAACPRCRAARLGVYQDRPADGRWHACGGCGWAGDAADLLAAAAGVPAALLPAALAAAGVPWPADPAGWATARGGYERQRARVAAALAAHPAAPAAAGPTAARLGLAVGPADRGWAGALGGRAFVVDGRAVCRALGHGPAAVGGPALALPLGTVPGRADGVFLVGRPDPGTAPPEAVRPAVPGAEAGVWGADTVEAGRKFLGGETAFVVCDPLAAARVQARHARAADTPLPLLGAVTAGRVRTGRDGYQAAWDRRVVVLAAGRADPAAVAQATLCDGLVAAAPWLADRAARVPGPPAALLADAAQRAAPWADAVGRAGLTAAAAGELLAGVAAAGGDADAVAAALGGPPPPARRAARVGRAEFLELPDGWYKVGPGGRAERVWDVPLRLDRLVVNDDGSGCVYEGRLLPAGRDPVRFTAACDALERDPRGTLTRACRLAGVAAGPPVGRAGVSLLAVACAFGPPQLVEAVVPAHRRA